MVQLKYKSLNLSDFGRAVATKYEDELAQRIQSAKTDGKGIEETIKIIHSDLFWESSKCRDNLMRSYGGDNPDDKIASFFIYWGKVHYENKFLDDDARILVEANWDRFPKNPRPKQSVDFKGGSKTSAKGSKAKKAKSKAGTRFSNLKLSRGTRRWPPPRSPRPRRRTS